MNKIITSLIFLLFFMSCTDTPPSETATDLAKEDTISTDESNLVEPYEPATTGTAPEGSCKEWDFAWDGPDNEVALTTDCDIKNGEMRFWSFDEENIENLQILAQGEYFYRYFKDKDRESENITAKLIGYYPNGRKMVEVDVVNGNRKGLFIVSDPLGKVLVYRDYKNNKFLKELHPHKWSFDTSNVTLDIDPKTAQIQGSKKVYSLMFVNQDDNDFYHKSIWDNGPLLIEGKPFTGILKGYTQTLNYDKEGNLEAFQVFSIEFKNGLLDGHFNMWDEFMGHLLEEVFTKGALKETLHKLNPEDMDGMAKPVIYLYPEKKQLVNVKLHLKGKIVHPYPRYDRQLGWNVMAQPNGNLKELNTGKDFYCLYWEGLSPHQFDLSTGFVVKGNESIEFLEEKLAQLGLNRREANEMIIYWLPRLEKNPYNLIHFSTEEYQKVAKLNISPQPDHLIRLMMVFKALQKPINIPAQKLTTYKEGRKGFTVVEWGGQEWKENEVSPIF